MKRDMPLTTFAMIFLTMLYVSMTPTAHAQDQAGCSNASVAGKWGFTTNGSVIGIGQELSGDIHTGRGWKPAEWQSNGELERYRH